MADTPRLSLPRPTGADLISQGDDVLTEMANTLDNAAIYATDVFASRPSAASLAGRFFYASDTGELFFSTGSAWLTIDSGPGVPIGGSLDYAGSGDPSDTRFLLEDGRAISRATYATLFGILGTTFGPGNGTTTFNIPDSRGRGSVAPDDMGTAAGAAGRMAAGNTLGATGGAETKALAAGNIPAHTHPAGTLANDTVADHTHGVGTFAIANESAHTHGAGTYAVAGSGSLTTGSQSFLNTTAESGDHLHGISPPAARDSGVNGIAAGSAIRLPQYDVTTTGGRNATHVHEVPAHTHPIASHGHGFSGTSAAGSAHTHGFSGSSAASGGHTHAISGSTGSTGSGTAYNQMHPYVVKNKIIRVL